MGHCARRLVECYGNPPTYDKKMLVHKEDASETHHDLTRDRHAPLIALNVHSSCCCRWICLSSTVEAHLFLRAVLEDVELTLSSPVSEDDLADLVSLVGMDHQSARQLWIKEINKSKYVALINSSLISTPDQIDNPCLLVGY